MNKFAVGDTAWYAKCRQENIKQICPTCFGKKEVTLILGSGERIILPCGGCAPGYNKPPTGYVHEYDYVVAPEQIIITGMSIEVVGEKETTRYKSDYYSFDDTDLFSTKEEAKIRAEAKKKELEGDQRTRAEYIKKNVHKSFSWNANYHMREAKRHKKDASRHDEKAKLCKERVRKGSK